MIISDQLISSTIKNINWNDSDNIERLYSQLYERLKHIAQAHLSKMAPSNTISATVLVNESFLTLSKDSNIKPENAQHFLALTSKAMRFYLLDLFKKKNSYKRKAQQVDITLSHFEEQDNHVQFDTLHGAIATMESINSELSQLIDLRFFWGMTLDEIATLKGMNTSRVYTDWKMAKSMLHNLLTEQ